MNTGGTNGTVTSITSTASGSNVTVSFPAGVPPPPNAKEETYSNVPQWALDAFRDGRDPRPKVDVTCDGSGNPTSVKTHA